MNFSSNVQRGWRSMFIDLLHLHFGHDITTCSRTYYTLKTDSDNCETASHTIVTWPRHHFTLTFHITNAGSRVVWDDTKVLNIWIYGWALYLVWLTLSHSALHFSYKRPHASNNRGWVWCVQSDYMARLCCNAHRVFVYVVRTDFDMAAIVCSFFGCLFWKCSSDTFVLICVCRCTSQDWKWKCGLSSSVSIFNAVLKLHVNFLFAVRCPVARHMVRATLEMYMTAIEHICMRWPFWIFAIWRIYLLAVCSHRNSENRSTRIYADS